MEIKGFLLWIIVFIAALFLLTFAITGRLAIGLAIQFTPDNVSYIGQS